MSNSERIEYEEALRFAETNQRKAVAAIPAKLLAKEDRFIGQMRRAKAGPLKKLEMLYSLMGELSVAMSPFTPCNKGCSACCHYHVSVSEIEVDYIERHTRHRRSKILNQKQNFHGQSCPFLEGGACSIYAARPFVCRRHIALTPNAYWCHHERSNQTFPLISFTSIDGAFDEIQLATNAESPSDIRQYFGVGGGVRENSRRVTGQP